MKAVTWQGKRDVRVESVPDPKIVEDNDIIIEVTTTDLHGAVPGGQAEYLRVQHGDDGPIKVLCTP